MPKSYQRVTVDRWRIELSIPAKPGNKRRKWIHLTDVDTKEEADQWTQSFRFRTRFRVKRFAEGGNRRGGSGRPKKQKDFQEEE